MSFNHCEGLMQPWAHKGFVRHYQLYDAEGAPDTKGYLCSSCVKDDIRKGYDWRLIKEKTNETLDS